jgi:polar amino acid transport system substrate-binding protein
VIKRFSIIVLVTAFAALMVGCGQTSPRSTLDRVKSRGELVVGVKGDAPPFGFKDKYGDLWGFDVDLGKAIAKKLGVKAKFVPLVTAQRIPALKSGNVDMVAACMTITRSRARAVDFSMQYFETYQALLVRKDSKITDYLDLPGKKVGAVKGSTGMATIKIVAPDAVRVPFVSYDYALKALIDGKIEAVATDYIILAGLLHGKKDKLKIVGRFGWEPYGIAMRQNDSKFRSRVNEALQDLWDEGAYQRIYDNWLGKRGRYPTESSFTITTFPRGNLKKK